MTRVRALERLIRPSLERSGEGRRFDELCDRVERGGALLFEGARCCFVVELIHDHDGFTFNIWIVGGEMADARNVLPGIEALARGLGCPFISFSGGRAGWRRVMSKLGYVWCGHEYRKAL